VENSGTTNWENAVLDGGPADGLRTRVIDRPRVVQVTYPCLTDGLEDGVRTEALYLYRLDPGVTSEPLRYGFDVASP
jgi:hypothetical protein